MLYGINDRAGRAGLVRLKKLTCYFRGHFVAQKTPNFVSGSLIPLIFQKKKKKMKAHPYRPTFRTKKKPINSPVSYAPFVLYCKAAASSNGQETTKQEEPTKTKRRPLKNQNPHFLSTFYL